MFSPAPRLSWAGVQPLPFVSTQDDTEVSNTRPTMTTNMVVAMFLQKGHIRKILDHGTSGVVEGGAPAPAGQNRGTAFWYDV